LVKKRSRSFVSALWSIARFLASFDFRLLQQYRQEAEHAAHSALQISLVDAPAKPARRCRASGDNDDWTEQIERAPQFKRCALHADDDLPVPGRVSHA
jgi:hypothetical protein